jgi:hypothetical protein
MNGREGPRQHYSVPKLGCTSRTSGLRCRCRDLWQGPAKGGVNVGPASRASERCSSMNNAT